MSGDYIPLDSNVVGQFITCSNEKDGLLYINGWKKSKVKAAFFSLFSILSLGTLYLLCRWFPKLNALLQYTQCSLATADYVLMKDTDGYYGLIPVKHCAIREGDALIQHRFFVYKLIRFVWNNSSNEFEQLHGLDNGVNTLGDMLYMSSKRHDTYHHKQMLQLYGENLVEVKVDSYIKLFFDEILHPFYVFQIISVVVWSMDEYSSYAACVFIMSTVSIVVSIYETRQQKVMLRDLTAASNVRQVKVLCDQEYQEVDSRDLIPGDIIEIPAHGCVMTCDAVLLTGTCIVNECMLTGESLPTTKSPPVSTNEIYDVNVHGRHTLYCGTQVIQTRFYHHDKVLALVVRTGSLSAKGQLVRSILYPKEVYFKFYRDSFKFLSFLGFVAGLGMIYCIYLYHNRGASLREIILRSLDIITIVVPPALPAALTAGIVSSQGRLKALGIFCTSTSRINMSGKVKVVCFDKTGTLTDEGFTVHGVLPANLDSSEISENDLVKDATSLPAKSPVLATMGSCHSLTYIDKKLCGDPVDLCLFNATKWELEESGKDTYKFDLLMIPVVKPATTKTDEEIIEEMIQNPEMVMETPYEIGLLYQFPFSSRTRTMSVIGKVLGKRNMTLYTKGAPEKIKALCTKDSIPTNLDAVLHRYTSAGFRVIALAYKELPRKLTWAHAMRMNKHEMEVDLDFLGLVILHNTLKPQTIPIIKQLQKANIKCIMATGDNILTAISVSRDSDLIHPDQEIAVVIAHGPSEDVPPTITFEAASTGEKFKMVGSHVKFAIDGNNWAMVKTYFTHLLPLIVTKGVVFARMSPDQKTQLIELLQDLGYIVAMVGDGANDCGALKAAHVGVSLSSAEASIAAPFTSKVADISCVSQIIREGRCALVTSFGLFKYMASYSIIQFVSVLILYHYGLMMGDLQFLYVDLVVTSLFALAMGYTKPAESLSPQRPIINLFSAANIIPLILQFILVFVVQISSVLWLQRQPWYAPVSPAEKDDDVILCWEDTVIFCVSCYQYFILATIYSKGPPHRVSFFKNTFLVIVVVSMTSFTAFFTVAPSKFIANQFELMPWSPSDPEAKKLFRLSLLLFPICNFLLSYLIENVIAHTPIVKKVFKLITCSQGYIKNPYKQFENSHGELDQYL
ncbi:unnamed protein product [Bemisia tabaci]|uniref:Cation-transporting ATPase n=1 Tax=Bemisia tabaci TaxID=7038 RepID=A0A9P0F5B4_BEMTA|nr:unnamed protein product [Bemisia tabaci]